MKKTHRVASAYLIAVILCVCLTGCSRGQSNNQTTQTTQSPQPSAPAVTTAPEPSPESSPSAQPTQEAMNWNTGYADVEQRVNLISEVGNSCVLVEGDLALVGVTFDAAYQGDMTERVSGMIAGEIQSADPAVQTVGVTAETADVEKITQLAEQSRAGNPPDDLREQMDAILNNATTMK